MLKFPIIRHLRDVLPYVENDHAFSVKTREDHTVINYVYSDDSVFPNDNSFETQIRRECRGLIFDQTGRLIRRPFHKFFNLNEKEHTKHENVNWDSVVEIQTKLDGSLVAPYILNDRLIWGTKAGETEYSAIIEKFLEDKQHIVDFVKLLISMNMTPCFEFTSPNYPIVVHYDDTELRLLAIRDMFSGVYLTRDHILAIIDNFCRGDQTIPLVHSWSFHGNEFELIKQIEEETNGEGVIVVMSDGERIKIKSLWYVGLHRTRSAILQEHHLVNLIVTDKIDDVIPHLPERDQKKVKDYVFNFNIGFSGRVVDITNDLVIFLLDEGFTCIETPEDLREFKKTFAVQTPEDQKEYRTIVFSLDHSGDDPDYRGQIERLYKKHLAHVSMKSKAWSEYKDSNEDFQGLKWDMWRFSGEE